MTHHECVLLSPSRMSSTKFRIRSDGFASSTSPRTGRRPLRSMARSCWRRSISSRSAHPFRPLPPSPSPRGVKELENHPLVLNPGGQRHKEETVDRPPAAGPCAGHLGRTEGGPDPEPPPVEFSEPRRRGARTDSHVEGVLDLALPPSPSRVALDDVDWSSDLSLLAMEGVENHPGAPPLLPLSGHLRPSADRDYRLEIPPLEEQDGLDVVVLTVLQDSVHLQAELTGPGQVAAHEVDEVPSLGDDPQVEGKRRSP